MCEVLDRIEKQGIERDIRQGIEQGIEQGIKLKYSEKLSIILTKKLQTNLIFPLMKSEIFHNTQKKEADTKTRYLSLLLLKLSSVSEAAH